ncbi:MULTISPECIES: alpha/beta fold hydrolase [unclassified Isoptericola]|uniref:alpha/beta fold hydrolase n=1 Tax=unclassified Isoptericola TaxID=2623355 RepID=UPI0027131440|nr:MULTISPECIES: alpha/beta fold hydrolase [unclassified Isoptericola]MDO8144202.1 alpha/beta fold hydrolase [Isoptericola sp. 178]MDO8151531.1 alpha/beta fold hydrolase [Isoptericola sp. b408]
MEIVSAALLESHAPTTPTRQVGVVLVHGMRQDGSAWARQVDHLEALGHSAVAVDLPGHGRRMSERFSFRRAWDHLDDAVASFPRDTPVMMVGQSLGGYVSLGWAAQRTTPDEDRPLLGVVASGCSTEPRGKPVRLYRDVADGLVRAGSSVMRRLAPGAGNDRDDRPGWDLVTDALGELSGWSALADLEAVDVPVWLVNGARCHLRWQEQRFARTADRGALVVVPGIGHDVHLDAPDDYNRVLSRALADFARD